MKTYVLSLLILLCSSALSSEARAEQVALADMIESSGWVLRVSVTAIDEAAYDFATKEAFTKVDLAVIEVLAGETSEKTLSLMLRGGLLPNGDYDVWSIVPELVVGETCVVMLHNGDYTLTPFVADVYREKRVAGQDVLVDQDGFVVDLSGEFPVRLSKKFGDTRLLRDQQREGRLGRVSNASPGRKGRDEEALPATAKRALSRIRELCADKQRRASVQKTVRKSAKAVIQPRPSKFEPKLSGA